VFAVPLELFTPRALGTWELLSVLASLHPRDDFSLIIGSDNLESLHKWSFAQPLMRYCRFLCCPRPGYEAIEKCIELYERVMDRERRRRRKTSQKYQDSKSNQLDIFVSEDTAEKDAGNAGVEVKGVSFLFPRHVEFVRMANKAPMAS